MKMDYVSTTRPPVKIGRSASQSGRKKAMNTTRFYDMLRKIGLGDDEAWACVVEEEGEFDQAIDNALQEVSSD